ncbi:MAG: M81 family metallopeptidase [Gammaproteobacteria bacterium]|nr:M81 family metallopeptidase [Gammaproteobacteria bacterium]
MKIVVALMQHETNTFSPLPTTLQSFASGVGLLEPPAGEQAIDVYGKADFAFSAMIDVARESGAEICVPIAAYAEPSGKVADAAFEFIADKICAAVAEGCDALLLDLHGAMVTESHDDGEGELLRRIRKIAPELPIAVALDFHTNLTADMVDNCSVIDGYRTYPHIDMYATGERAANSLFNIMHNKLATRMRWRSLPMMTHMIKQTPALQPMKDIMDRAIAAVDSGALMNASIFGGFPLADIPQVSLSVLTLEQSGQTTADQLIDDLCAMAWERRADFIFEAEALSASIERVKSLNEFPIVVADHGDNSGAGGSSDDLTVLEEMLNHGLTDIITGPIWDPQAVAQMIATGEGAEVALSIGGKTDVVAINQVGHGMLCRGRVSKITNGRFTLVGPMQTGLVVNIGRSVVLDIGAAKMLVSEERWEPYDPGCFTHAGLHPEEFRYILIKSRQHFRAAYEPIAEHVVLAAGPGVCSSDYAQFPFARLTRPIYPLDLDTTCDGFE